ncbi:hypothetical protein HBI56_085590 [Parastagonospora nodorum]|nr:hypothetical protein HBH56_101020 [Parastagonospora nodorum]KAH3929201.1 hypothetical protein HBH54_129410 [Parastagonospora nodorum]KAH3951482.1 hypothetical protein HBH53_063440 [Parastagonospora nodorum]KAH3975299.1 hypothetical protein HBH52_123440 [Parastagonospora nodorum]KAH3978856.1 hypothetical protein HBH51_060380 [Parastagonospora nodorum]
MRVFSQERINAIARDHVLIGELELSGLTLDRVLLRLSDQISVTADTLADTVRTSSVVMSITVSYCYSGLRRSLKLSRSYAAGYYISQISLD